MITVSRRAHRHEDRAGDPLDGLVNLFDLGIVLSVAFLLAALSSLDLETALTDGSVAEQTPAEQSRAQLDAEQSDAEREHRPPPRDQVVVPRDAAVEGVPNQRQKVLGRGEEVGSVYRLADGRLIYVVPRSEGP